MVIQGKGTRPLSRGVRFLECPLIRDFTAFVSFLFSHAWAGDQCSLSNLSLLFPKQLCLSGKVDVSGMELEKSHSILHIRGQNCLLATRLHTQFHYIYKIPKTCLFLPKYSEMRSLSKTGNVNITTISACLLFR